MYAVIKTGGKQHKVKAGDTIRVELLEGNPGDKVTFEPILVVDDQEKPHFGKDLTGASVTGVLAGEVKGEKIRVFKYKPKSGYSRRQGHRQTLTVVEIEEIGFSPPTRTAKKREKADEPSGGTPTDGDE